MSDPKKYQFDLPAKGRPNEVLLNEAGIPASSRSGPSAPPSEVSTPSWESRPS